VDSLGVFCKFLRHCTKSTQTSDSNPKRRVNWQMDFPAGHNATQRIGAQHGSKCRKE